MSVPRYAGSICGSEQSSSTRWIFPFAFPIHAPTRVPRGLWGCAGPATHQYSREPMPQVRPRSSRGEPPRINSQPCLLRRLTRSCSSSDSERFRVRHLQSGSLSIEVRARIVAAFVLLGPVSDFSRNFNERPLRNFARRGRGFGPLHRAYANKHRSQKLHADGSGPLLRVAMLLPRLVGIILGVERGEGYWRSLVR